MWVRFPKGTNSISIQQMNFNTEFKDDEGNEYFRAPSHFAGIIATLPRFAAVARPSGAPEDLPAADPLRDGAIADLGTKVSTLEAQLKTANETLGTLRAQLTASEKSREEATGQVAQLLRETEVLKTENSGLLTQLRELEAKSTPDDDDDE